ncbi:MAG TPA: cobalamin-independent methionine synthase II family protein [Dehalococcoidia bacterium]|nr:cobalamin-independent methionine synthase II family protein [Dehalococcoidia bacterium]
MKRSTDRILTTHAGRLAGGRELAQMARNTPDFKDWVRNEMKAAVDKQIAIGLDSISDGEFGKYGGFDYYSKRMSGLAQRPVQPGEPAIMSQNTNERKAFAEFYADMARGQTVGANAEDMRRWQTVQPQRMICNAPISYTGQAEVKSDIDQFATALQGTTPGETFLCVLAPGWIEHSLYNEFYKSDEEFLFAVAEAMSHEYKAIVDAGHVLQLDDPGLPDTYDMIVPAPSIEEYRKFAEIRVDAMNHALRGIPADRVRYHICWGSWHGPHAFDLELKYVVDLMLKVNAEAYSVEAANPRHEHEWRVWKDTKLPDGKILIPGVVSHASNVVEHPELVADRIVQYANLVGRENVIAGTDCGMGGRVHMQVGWAKLQALTEGAALASKELWGR